MVDPQSVMPQAQVPVAPPQAQGDQEIQDTYAKLQQMIGGMGPIDFEKMYAPSIQKAQERPVSQMPGRGSIFAAALGAPQFTQNFVQDRMKQINQEKSQKEADVAGLQEQALRGHISQLMEEGNFKKALAQSETLAKLQNSLDNIKRTQSLDDWHEKQKTIFGNKEKLQEQKAGQAEQLIKTRAKEIAKGMGFDERMALKLLDLTSAPLLSQFRAMVSRNPLTGEQDMDVDAMSGWVQQIDSMIRAKAEELKATVPGEGKSSPATPAKASAGSAENDPIRAAHAKLFKK